MPLLLAEPAAACLLRWPNLATGWTAATAAGAGLACTGGELPQPTETEPARQSVHVVCVTSTCGGEREALR